MHFLEYQRAGFCFAIASLDWIKAPLCATSGQEADMAPNHLVHFAMNFVGSCAKIRGVLCTIS